MNYPVERERWFTFRSERLRVCMESWMTAHSVTAVERPKWDVPTVDEVKEQVADKPEKADKSDRVIRKPRAAVAESPQRPSSSEAAATTSGC